MHVHMLAVTLALFAPVAVQDADDAATWYRRAFTEVENPTRTDQVVRMLERGASCTRCDFPDRPSEAPFDRPEWAEDLRRCLDIASAELDHQRERRDHEGVVNSLGLLIRVAAHQARAARVSTCRDAIATLTHVADVIDELAAHGHLTPARSVTLVRALDRLDDRDPVLMLPALARDRDRVTQWALEMAWRPGGIDDLRAELDTRLSSAALRAELTTLDPRSVLTEVELATAATEQLLDAFTAPDLRAAQIDLARLSREIGAARYGVVQAAAPTPFDEALIDSVRLRERMTRQHRMLTEIIDGAGPEAFVDGGRRLDLVAWGADRGAPDLARRARMALRNLDGNHAGLHDDLRNVESHLDAVAKVLDMHSLFTGAPEELIALDTVHASARILVEMLLADVLVSLERGEPDRAIGRLADARELALRLAADDRIMSVRLAGDLLREIDAVERHTESMLDPDRAATLRAVIDSAPDADRLHAAVTADRRRLERWLLDDVVPATDLAHSETIRHLGSCDADRLLLLVLAAQLDAGGADPTGIVLRLGRGPGAVDLDVARGQCAEIVRAVRAGHCAALRDAPAPRMTQVISRD